MNISALLANPVIASGHVVSKVMLDLTVYLVGPTEPELEYLINLYDRICPVDHQAKYKVAELSAWSRVSPPILTEI